MFKRILIPTDGSDASQRAILAGAAFAHEIGAEIVGLTVTPEFHVLSADSEMLEDTPDEFAARGVARARRILADVDNAARDAGVACRSEHAVGDDPYEAIIDTARNLGCDLILMASHGRRGLKGFLLGSVTQKVLVHSALPVLVHR